MQLASLIQQYRVATFLKAARPLAPKPLAAVLASREGEGAGRSCRPWLSGPGVRS